MRSCLHWKGFLPFFFPKTRILFTLSCSPFTKQIDKSSDLYKKWLSNSHCPREHFAIAFLHTLLLKHCVYPCDFHTNYFLYSELFCLMLYLQCVITSLIPSLLEAIPAAPQLQVPQCHLCLTLPETRVSQWVHKPCALTSLTWDTRSPFLLSPSPQPSSKPVPNHHANIRAVAISNILSVQPSAEAATNQTSSLCLSPDWIHHCTTGSFPLVKEWPC